MGANSLASMAGEGVGGALAGRTGISLSERPKVLGSAGDIVGGPAPGVDMPGNRPMLSPQRSAKFGVESPKRAPADPGLLMLAPSIAKDDGVGARTGTCGLRDEVDRLMLVGGARARLPGLLPVLTITGAAPGSLGWRAGADGPDCAGVGA